MRWPTALTALGAVGCNLLLGYTVPTLDDGGADADASSTLYGAFSDETRWTAFDLGVVTPKIGYAGGAFDGQYVYFSPSASTTPNGIVVRCDTTQPFAAAAWSVFDLTHWAPNLRGYEGAVADAEHVYFIPHDDGLFHGRVARYTKAAPFGATTSWDSYDLGVSVSASAVGFGAGAFDGRFVYFTPFAAGTAVRFDTASPLDAPASYELMHLSDTYRWRGAAFDGRAVYLIPNSEVDSATFGAIARYDTTMKFDESGSWRTFDLTTRVDARANGFFGSIFDGRYLYLVPATDTLAVRFDTLADLSDAAAWSTMDLAGVATSARGYAGGAFDGRYVYFAPTDSKLALRYDTTRPFGAVSSFEVFDVTSLDSRALGFRGAVFDGTAIYFVPAEGSVMARFRARDVAAPSSFASSFF